MESVMPSTLCGVDLLFVEWIAIIAYIALGAWLVFRAATRDEKPIAPWRWGDAPRRPKSIEARIMEHIGGVAIFLSVCVFGLHALGIG
jgi:hypothetical protein